MSSVKKFTVTMEADQGLEALKAASPASMSDSEYDEIDKFNANQEKILLEEAGNYGRNPESDESSEEEVLGIDEEDSDEENLRKEDDDELDESGEEEELEEDSDDEKNWGGRKNYYGGEDDEDVKMMTEEAMKQQKKHLQDLAMDDFVDEELMEDWKKKSEDASKEHLDEISVLKATDKGGLDTLSKKEKLKLLNQQFPEFVPLLGELQSLSVTLKSLESKKFEVAEVKRIALSAYLGSISSYFAIFMDSMKNDDGFNSMKENPVMESILSAKEVWRQANELSDDVVEHTVQVHGDSEAEMDVAEDWEAEMEDMERSAEEHSDEESEEEGEEESEEDEEEEQVSSRDTLPDITVKRTKAKGKSAAYGDFQESSTAHDVDLEDKTRRKKTLRFYTSRIDQAATKNSNAERFSGDLDLPYRERLFERQQRLVEEARKRGLAEKDVLGGDDDDNDFNDDAAFGNSGHDMGEDVHSGNDDGEDDYYNSIKQTKSNTKLARKQAHDDAVKAAKEGKLAELQESVGDDGKRAVNFQILKNKGLTPHRNKDNRNSRVKKRKKYEKAQKKLKSVRQVYDDNNRGPYAGEKTGIKKGISRSVKLN